MATGEVGNLRTRVSMDSTEFQRGAQQVNRELRLMKSETRLARTEMQGMGGTMNAQKGYLSALSNEEKGLRQAISLNRDEYEKYRREAELSGTATEGNTAKMANAANKMLKNEQQLAKVTAEMQRMNREILEQNSGLFQTGKSMEAAGKNITSFGRGMNTAANHLMKVSAVVGAIGGYAIKAAIDWESSVATMEKTISGTPQQMAELEQSIRNMAQEVPLAATELAELAGVAGQLGVETENIPAFTRVIADLSVATDIAGDAGAKMLAQFANITQMDQGDFDRLGSAIALVGNNTAATEAPILEMSQLLAGAGHSAGLAQSEIVGIAAGLSSLGISAERGGSSFSKLMIEMAVASQTGIEPLRELEAATGMTGREIELMASNAGTDFRKLADSLGMTTGEINEIVRAGSDLEGFARVAGLSADEFSVAFGENAAGAIGLFIDGLAAGNDESESAIQILDDLGISEIRLRDTLLRTGNAQGLLNETVALANQGWEENTELTREAELRYGTTESKIQLLRNRFTEIAITAGTEMLPAFIDLMDSVEGLAMNIADLVGWFAGLDSGTQALIFKIGAFVVAAGPMLKIFAALTTATGGLVTGGGKLLTWLAGMGIGATEASMSTAELSAQLAAGGKQTGIAGKGMLGLKAIFAGTAGSILAGVGIVAAVGAIAYGIYRVTENSKENAAEIEKWGSVLDEETKSAIEDFQELSDEASQSTFEMNRNIEEGAQGAIDSYNNMGSEITEGAREAIHQAEEELAQLPVAVREIMSGLTQDRVARHEEIIAEVESINESITAIYARAVEENRALTDAELQVVEDYHSRLTELRAQTLDESAEQQGQIQSVMLADLKNFSEEQLETRRQFLNDELNITRDGYERSREIITEELTKGNIEEWEANKKREELREAERESNLFFAKEYVKIWEERGMPIEQQEGILKEFGYTHAEIMEALMWESVEAAGATQYLAENLEDMSSETRDANNTWNEFALENKFGEVGTNVSEIIQEASESEQGWEMLEFVLKEAELSTTARETIEEALRANGTWDDLDFVDKEAPLFTNAQQTAMDYLKANGDWERLSFEEKIAFLDTNSPDQLKQILQDFGIWDRLDPVIQEMIATSNVPEVKRDAENNINEYNELRPRRLPLDGTTNIPTIVRDAQRAINSLTGKSVRIQTVHTTVGVPSGNYATRALGTQAHGGGLVVLGDGGKQEPYLTPDGKFGVSPSQDTMFDLPKGTKVWSSTAKFRADAMGNEFLGGLMKKLPHFATGTRESFMDNNRFPNVFESQSRGSDNSTQNTYNITVNATGDLPYNVIKRMTREIEKEMQRLSNKDNLARGNM